MMLTGSKRGGDRQWPGSRTGQLHVIFSWAGHLPLHLRRQVDRTRRRPYVTTAEWLPRAARSDKSPPEGDSDKAQWLPVLMERPAMLGLSPARPGSAAAGSRSARAPGIRHSLPGLFKFAPFEG